MRNFFATAIALAALTATLAAQTPRLGTIDFPTSGPPEAQGHFITGVLYLHSFEYDDAAKEFREAQRLAPDFAMAYWGEAMTYTHPLWDQQNLDSARAALNRLAPTPQARRLKAPTAREQGYLDAVEALYGEGTKPQRDTLYSAAMELVWIAYPDDLEAEAFYALSLLGLNQGDRDVPTYMRAGALAQEVFRKNPDHPGAAHYVIHAFDDPTHAPLGLYAARAYSQIAPAAAHAQHMTTHIFLALGMWDEVVSQNVIASGPDPKSWTAGHYTVWLDYGYLQQGRYQDALALLETLRGNLGSKPRYGALWGITEMRAHYLIDTELWNSPVDRWDIDLTKLGASGTAYWSFVSGYCALKRGDRSRAVQALAALTTVRDSISDAGPSEQEVYAILELELKSLLRLADGASEEAVVLLTEATRREDAVPFIFGPPSVIKPSHELFGEVLLQLGRPGEAETQFKGALALAPKRARSLIGLARAAAAAGDAAEAAEATATLQAIWHQADPGLLTLAGDHGE